MPERSWASWPGPNFPQSEGAGQALQEWLLQERSARVYRKRVAITITRQRAGRAGVLRKTGFRRSIGGQHRQAAARRMRSILECHPGLVFRSVYGPEPRPAVPVI